MTDVPSQEPSEQHFPDDASDSDSKPKKMTGDEQIQAYIEGFDEMIKFMDFSFERAFSQKDKEFMIAYREHIKEI